MKTAFLRLGLVGLVFVTASCSEAAPTAAEEVAGELRALRLLLAQQVSTASVPAHGGERVDVQAALAPLRTALETLAGSQRELADRQLVLTQEMQRWSQLLVETVSDTRAAEAKATTAKLRELEASLQSQDARHRQVETLIQGALDRTADQLDEFLRRLQGAAPAAPATSPAGAGGGAPSPVPAGTVAPGAGTGPGGQSDPLDRDGEVRGARPLAARSSQGSMRWWWLGLTGFGAAVATFFLRRARRPGPANRAANPAPPLASGTEQSVEEIWAAAALLGDAVSRLRQTGTSETPAADRQPFAGVPSATGESLLDEEFVLVEDSEPPTAAVPVARPAAAPAGGVGAAPSPQPGARSLDTMLARVPGIGSERQVLAALAEERQVLRRPAPSFRQLDGTLEVTFHVLPGTSAGERARLLQRLRDAVRGVG